MAQQDNPLSPDYYRQEFPDSPKNQASFGGIMVIPDVYRSTSQLSLRERIDGFKESLYAYYCEMVLGGLYDVTEHDEQEALDVFEKFYLKSLDRLRSGISALNAEEDLRNDLFFDSTKSVKETFPKILMWLISADILEQCSLPEEAWSTLLEFKGIEHRLVQCISEANKLNEKREKGRYGSRKGRSAQHLKKRFIELLAEKAPSRGWRTKTAAAGMLANDILEFHRNSPQSADFPLELGEVEKRLYNMLRKGNAATVFEKHKKLVKKNN